MYAWPLVNPPPIGFPARSAIPVPLAFRSSRIVPSPLIALTVMVYVLALTVAIEAIVPLAVPVPVSVKSEVPTPVTLSEKATVKSTVVAFVGVLPTRLIELTVGAMASTRINVVSRAGRVRTALLPTASWIVPPPVVSAPTVMPFGSALPETTL